MQYHYTQRLACRAAHADRGRLPRGLFAVAGAATAGVAVARVAASSIDYGKIAGSVAAVAGDTAGRFATAVGHGRNFEGFISITKSQTRRFKDFVVQLPSNNFATRRSQRTTTRIHQVVGQRSAIGATTATLQSPLIGGMQQSD